MGSHAAALHGHSRFTQDIENWVIGLDDLIANKRALGRTKDLGDLEALEAIRKAQSG